MTLPTDLPAPPSPGLSESEVAARRAAGRGNDVQISTGRSYARIVRDNVFNFINNLFYVLATILLVLGKPLDAFVVSFVILANTVISLVQEVRAKRLMDRIAILTRPTAVVVRDGSPRQVDPSEIVEGDLLYVGPGDQVVVDGPLVGEAFLEVDESLLTGESDLVPKRGGDRLLSGSFCMTGSGYYVAERVGLASYANQLTAKAKGYRRELTPLQRQVNQIVRVLLLVVVVFQALVWTRNVLVDVPFVESVRMATVILALIPNGLVLSIALTYALGAMRLLGKDVLVQQFNAIESLSNVDVLCTDKTGTLTTGSIAYETLLPLAAGEDEAQRLLAVFAASSREANRTLEAVREALPAAPAAVKERAAFSSARKWSGLVFDGDGEGAPRGTYVLGAPEMLAPALAAGPAWQPQAEEWAGRGLRVLLFAGRPDPVPFAPDGATEPVLPEGLTPLALVCLSDELRPGVQATLEEFRAAGVELKIISGDNPATVAALARQAGVHGLDGEGAVVAGPDLERLDEARLGEVAERAVVFGRVTPEQKQTLVRALRSRGRYVAMVGDGVNDVIALKEANVAVAVQGGSQAARGVSDLILLRDTFSPLPYAFREGQRILNGMNDILRIFMVRILFKASIIAVVASLGGFPFAPRQASLMSFVGAGVPAVVFAALAVPGPVPKVNLFRRLARFVLPTGVLMTLMATVVYLVYALPAKADYLAAHPGAAGGALLLFAYPRAQTALTLFACFTAILVLLLAVPPSPRWGGGAPVRGDWRIAGTVVLLLLFVAGVLAVPLGRTLFEITPLPWWQYGLILAWSYLWLLLCQWVWHGRLLDRWLGTERDPLARR